MIKRLQKKYALSEKGAKDLFKGILYSVLAYISLMLPVALLACVLNAFLSPLFGDGSQSTNALWYTIIGIVVLIVIFIMHYLQYTVTYMGTYEESERRRITLAEKLRKLPLRFFSEHDLSDLTNTIMGDCAGFEHAFSHTVPQFWGSIISTAIVCIALLIYDWRMGLALLWVAPVAFAIVLLSRKLQSKLGQKHIDAKLNLAEGIQECLETVQDIKACNLEESYLKKLDKKLENAEKAQISSEMVSASLITTGQMFLRLGLATVIVVGNMLMMNSQTTLFAYILFLIAASRLYEPLSGAMANMAAGFYDVNGGKITLGGTDIAPIDSVAMMKDFSVVFQNVVLFNNTVMENIRVARKNASDEDVIAAAKAARCHEFIEKLPEGYQTVIGENGSTLSGGECQRLSIARALLKDAPVILLDEATASLDVDNETEIQEAISRLVKGKTVLVIAHRMRTVENADKIVVLDGGVVAESGTHDELMQKNGLYAKLVKLQTEAANWQLGR